MELSHFILTSLQVLLQLHHLIVDLRQWSRMVWPSFPRIGSWEFTENSEAYNFDLLPLSTLFGHAFLLLNNVLFFKKANWFSCWRRRIWDCWHTSVFFYKCQSFYVKRHNFNHNCFTKSHLGISLLKGSLRTQYWTLSFLGWKRQLHHTTYFGNFD